MTVDPTFRTHALDIARAINAKIAEQGGTPYTRIGMAAIRLFEHVEHILHGRKSCDGPHLGADVQHLFPDPALGSLKVAAMALLTAIEFARYEQMNDAWILVEDAASIVGLPLRPKTVTKE